MQQKATAPTEKDEEGNEILRHIHQLEALHRTKITQMNEALSTRKFNHERRIDESLEDEESAAVLHVQVLAARNLNYQNGILAGKATAHKSESISFIGFI